MNDAETYLPKDLAQRYRVKMEIVLGWIKSGDLSAINVASADSSRPRCDITPEAIDAFEAGRASRPPPRARRTRRRAPTDVIEFFTQQRPNAAFAGTRAAP